MVTRHYVTDYLRTRTTNATPKVLTLDGDPVSVNYPGNRLKVEPNETVTYELTLTARQAIATGSKQFFRRFSVSRVGSTTSVVGVASEDIGTPSWSVAITADSLGPVITVTGASITIDWIGRIRVVNRVQS